MAKPVAQAKLPPGSYFSPYWCGCCLKSQFIVTEGETCKTEVCPHCGAGNQYQRAGTEWKRVEPTLYARTLFGIWSTAGSSQ